MLAGWRSWGAVPQIFDEDTARAHRLRGLLTDAQWQAARRTTINAHYTDPAIAAAIWQVALDLGFEAGGRVLEPGCGSGVFIGAAPVPVRTFAGVELDPVTAAITQALYPQAAIRTESFADSRYPENAFHLTIGNVPFAKITLHDPVHNSGRHSMHNHFIIKSLALTRPGGLVAVLTSRYTLDAENDASRREMHARADLLAAVRLPSGAHRRYAGTEAVTDLVIFQVRPPGTPPGPDDWLTSVPHPQLGVLNRYWAAHPEAVLGRQRLDAHGLHGRTSLVVDPDQDLTGLPARITRTALDLAAARLSQMPPAATPPAPPEPAAVVEASLPQLDPPGTGAPGFDGHLVRRDDGTWYELDGGVLRPVTVPASCAVELAVLVRLRDAVLAVLEAEAATRDDTPALTEARTHLARSYRRYQATYGPINRVTVTTTTRLDKAGNPITTRRYPAAARIFRSDPHSATVRALELYDEATGAATPAAILTRRVLSAHTIRDRAETPEDALAICLDTLGRVELPRIAALLGLAEPEQARTQLGTLVFDDPVTATLVPAAAYLSGNVRAALAAAQDAATQDPRYQVNVEHLGRVIPPDLTSSEIVASLGAIWIPASDIRDFLTDVLGASDVIVDHLGGAKWKIRGGASYAPAATVTWGTSRINAYELAERLMCQKKIIVHDLVPDANGRDVDVVNPVETEAAAAKADALQARFREWIWSDPARETRLTRVYNDTFNALVLRSYDTDGQRLSLPGLAADFTPHPHQRAAVARMIGEPSVGLFHAVGAGKTAEMVMGATELRRLGLVTKPAVIVPNHMLEQFTREWLQLYPAANILAAATDDLRGEARPTFIARAATGDWDAVILTQGAFAAIPVSPDGQRAYLQTEVDLHRTQLERARAAKVSALSLKQMEGALIRLEERIKRRLDHKTDPGLTWEQLGIDYLIVDELHLYKNLAITSNIQDVARDGSDRATDLDMKINLLRAAAGPGGRVLTGATATPIANTMAEAWVMQKYLRPDLLHDTGLTDFDSWAATFGQTVTKLEMRPAGDGFRVKDRFAAFQNVPELLAMWHVPADVKTSRDLGLPVPAIARDHTGRRTPEVVAIPMTDAQGAFMTTLAERAEQIRMRAVTPDIDNMLKVSGDGRKAGLDLRLLTTAPTTPAADPGLFPELGKLDVAAARIHRIWADHRADTYPASPTPGSLQIVFCDLGTPTDERWNVYHALRDLLTEHGMDPARIRFIHDAKTDAAKGRLFAQCRAGEVDVIIGSTAKMGVGTNIQHRAVALHHLDCPWRPADVEQREGRILRQGNHHTEVQILRYVSEGSFDAFMWQGVARKAAFIDQIMHATLGARTAEDLDSDGEQFDYATVTAVASGNPLLLQRAEAAADLDKLARLAAAHERNQGARRVAIRDADHAIATLSDLSERLAPAIAATTPTAGDAFTAHVDNLTYTARPDAAAAARRVINTHAAALGPLRPAVDLPALARLGGHTLDAALTRTPATAGISLTITVHDLPEARFSLPLDAMPDGHGLITRAENLLTGLPALLASTRTRLETARRDRAEASTELGQPFPHTEQLHAAQARLDQIDAALNPTQNHPGPTTPERPRHTPERGTFLHRGPER